MSPTGTPEFPITDGTIVPVAGASESGRNHLGGYGVMIEAAYDVGPVEKGHLFYYAHMDRESVLPVGASKIRRRGPRSSPKLGRVPDEDEAERGTSSAPEEPAEPENQ